MAGIDIAVPKQLTIDVHRCHSARSREGKHAFQVPLQSRAREIARERQGNGDYFCAANGNPKRQA